MELETSLVQEWKEQGKNDVEIIQAYEDIIQDGFVFLDINKISCELTRYNLFHNLTGKKEIRKKIKEKIELTNQMQIRKMEENPSVKIIKKIDKMYYNPNLEITFCSCESLSPLRVKRVEIEKVIEREEKLVKERQYHQLFIYCRDCGEIYWSPKDVPKLL